MSAKEDLAQWVTMAPAEYFKLKLMERIGTDRRLGEAEFRMSCGSGKLTMEAFALMQGKLMGMENVLEMLENLANDKT